MEATLNFSGSVSLSLADDDRILVGESVLNELFRDTLKSLLDNYVESQDDVELLVVAEAETEEMAFRREQYRTVQVKSLVEGEGSVPELPDENKIQCEFRGRVTVFEDGTDWYMDKPVLREMMLALHGVLDRYDGMLNPIELHVRFDLNVLTDVKEDTLVSDA